MLKWVVSAKECAKSIDRKLGLLPPSVEKTCGNGTDFGRVRVAGARKEVRRTQSLPGNYEHSTRLNKFLRYDQLLSQRNDDEPGYIQSFELTLSHPHSSSELHLQRIKLFQQIEREQRLRDGAEKLLKATDNVRVKEKICRELSQINSNLQLMREKQARLAVTFFEGEVSHIDKQCIPMISVGMKEMKGIKIFDSFKVVLTSHYFEDEDSYKFELNHLIDMRQMCREPPRDETGLEYLFNYFNQLYFLDRRFFPASGIGPISFEWYDSLTGLPCSQDTVGFEKGSILFNIGVLFAQLAIESMETDVDRGLAQASECFRRSAGAFHHLRENFSHAPSLDMQPATTNLLVHLMLIQGRECLVEEMLQAFAGDDVHDLIGLAQDLALVSSMYLEAISMLPCIPSTPLFWSFIFECKQQYYNSLAHYYMALALALLGSQLDLAESSIVLGRVYLKLDAKQQQEPENHKIWAKSHLRQSIISSEAALKFAAKNAKLQMGLYQKLKQCHARSLEKFFELEEEDDFSEVMTAFEILGKSKINFEPIPVDFPRYKVDDLFHRLGCIAIFSARHEWTRPRTVTLKKTKGQEFGFSIRGDSPVIIASVDPGSLANQSEMLVGDFIVRVGETDVKWTRHDKVAAMIRSCQDFAILQIVTPIDRNYIDPTLLISEANPDLFDRNVSCPVKEDKQMSRTPESKVKAKQCSSKVKAKPRSVSVGSKYRQLDDSYVVIERNFLQRS